jgi:chromosome segregation ATPase
LCFQELDVASQRLAVDLLAERFAKTTRARQKLEFSQVLSKRWKREQEKVKSVFSKWARVALLHAIVKANTDRERVEQDIYELQTRQQDSQAMRKKLENENSTLLERVAVLDQTRATLESEAESNLRIIENLTCEITQIRQERDYLMSKEANWARSEGSRSPNVDRDLERRLSQREVDVERRERIVNEIELTLHDRDQKAVGEFESTQNRIRRMAEQLQRKEFGLDAQQKYLEGELAKSQATQSRLHELATMLRRKAQQIENDGQSLLQRMQDCDTLESELTAWQNQLELGKIPLRHEQEGTRLRES